ncbi:MAG: hypothetical protein JXA41_12930 [Deltaproteobacteria bacterium]|nr:hypothetical protein [Deltaproteobacteria bacterium]
MRKWTFPLPFPSALSNAGESHQGRKPRGGVKAWKKSIAQQWVELGRPSVQAIRIGIVFSFPDREACNLKNCLAMVSTLTGDDVKDIFIVDNSSVDFVGLNCCFEFAGEAKATFLIEEAARKAPASSTPGFTACRLSEECVAPLCPLDESSLRGIWYPGEKICPSRTYGKLPWLKAQRKVARVTATGYFTVEMLSRLVIIRDGITGLDPNLPEEPQLHSWFQKRADKQEAQPDEKSSRTRHLKKYRFRKQAGGGA